MPRQPRRSAQPLDVMRTPWWQSPGNLLFWVLSRIWAPMMAVGWPILVIYGMANPRPDDLAVLNLARSETPFLVGAASDGISGQRSYLLPRRFLKSDGLIIVHDDNGRLTSEPQPGVAFLVIGVWFGCIWASWWFLLRPRFRTSNNSFERTRDG
jgi:hypothetical protein